MADEHISRFDYPNGKPRRRFVEDFYPHEKASGELYHAPMKKDGHGHYNFYSQRLADLINSHYINRDKIATLDAARLLSSPDDCRLRYAQGAYRRYHDRQKNVIIIANAGYKVETIGKVLISLGATDVALISTDTIPVAHSVFFIPGEKLARALPIKSRTTKAEFARKPYGQNYRELGKGK